MKRNSILLCILFAITANFITPAAKAQVNTTDSLALVDLYNSTHGPHWSTHTNWLTTKPVSTWYGVTVTGNRVVNVVLASNGLHGTIPASVGNLTNLHLLNFSNNQLTGTIPAEIGNLKNLIDLYLSDNQLNGTIPASIGNLVNLNELYLYANQLSGAIPTTVGNLTNLTQLILFYNQLSGTIPSTLGNLPNVTSIDFDNNQLSGAIPSTLGNIPNLGKLYLYNNQLSGVIPAALGNLQYLVYLDIGNNKLSGTIPSKLGNLLNLTNLGLYGNQLSGAVPASFNKLTSLLYLDISYNLLSKFGDANSFSSNANLQGKVNNNLFSFAGLQSIAKKYRKIVYAPQDTILPIHKNGNVLSVSAGGTLSNNTYTWYKVGNINSTTFTGDSTFEPAQSGRYYVTVINKVAKKLTLYSDTISYTMHIAQTANGVANIADLKTFTNHFSIHPNPAKDIVHIQVNGNAIISLTNNAGKVLLTKTINNSDAIDVSAFANGIYYLQNKTTGEMQKIIVVH